MDNNIKIKEYHLKYLYTKFKNIPYLQYISLSLVFLYKINDKVFAGFETPKSLKQSYEIIKNHFKVNGWTTGNRGITFTLKAG